MARKKLKPMVSCQRIAPNELRALRMVRRGADHQVVCGKLMVDSKSIVELDNLFKDVPDRLLSGIETIVSDHDKLCRLITTLTRTNRY